MKSNPIIIYCIYCHKNLGKLDCSHRCNNCSSSGWNVEYHQSVSITYDEIYSRSVHLNKISDPNDSFEKWRYVHITYDTNSYLGYPPGPPSTAFIAPGKGTIKYNGFKFVTPANVDEWHDRLNMRDDSLVVNCFVCNQPCERNHSNYPNDPSEMGWENWKCKNHKIEINHIYDLTFSDEVTVSSRILNKITFPINHVYHHVDISSSMTKERFLHKMNTRILFS